MGEYQADVNERVNIADRYPSGESRFREHENDDDSVEDGGVAHKTAKPMLLKQETLERMRLETVGHARPGNPVGIPASSGSGRRGQLQSGYTHLPSGCSRTTTSERATGIA